MAQGFIVFDVEGGAVSVLVPCSNIANIKIDKRTAEIVVTVKHESEGRKYFAVKLKTYADAKAYFEDLKLCFSHDKQVYTTTIN